MAYDFETLSSKLDSRPIATEKSQSCLVVYFSLTCVPFCEGQKVGIRRHIGAM